MPTAGMHNRQCGCRRRLAATRSDGQSPNMARNAVLKCAELEKPALCAATVSEAPAETAVMAAPIRFQI